MHEAFYGKYNGIFRACADSVYQASPRGGRGLGTRLVCVYAVCVCSFISVCMQCVCVCVCVCVYVCVCVCVCVCMCVCVLKYTPDV